MKLKKYMVYLDDGKDVFKIAVPAENEADARKFVEGNGEVVAIKDVTDEIHIPVEKVANALVEAHFPVRERDFIQRALVKTGICDYD